MNTVADALAALPGYADLGPDDLILSHFSLGRFRPFEERVRAAAEAGFAAMGLYVGDYQRLRADVQAHRGEPGLGGGPHPLLERPGTTETEMAEDQVVRP